MLMWGQGPRGPGEVCGVDAGFRVPGEVCGVDVGSGSPGTRGGLWC